jgi:hypothetical protein
VRRIQEQVERSLIFSKPLDTEQVFGKTIGKSGGPCIVTIQGAAGQTG